MSPTMRAARLISEADGLLITAGAGMGVDSGLPDFRGSEGFWNAYPSLGKAKIDFRSIATPAVFSFQPKLAWGFYGHRLSLYRETVPHKGFHILKTIADQMPQKAFVITSNVDGQFQKAGFSQSQVMEIHGSIHRLQCSGPCHENVWSAALIEPVTDDAQCEWRADRFPSCPKCRKVARPNILMFNDMGWIDTYTTIERAWFEQWIAQVNSFVVLEIGAGTDLPSIRRIGQSLGAPLIRLNPRGISDSDASIALDFGALDGLRRIQSELESIGSFAFRREQCF